MANSKNKSQKTKSQKAFAKPRTSTTVSKYLEGSHHRELIARLSTSGTGPGIMTSKRLIIPSSHGKLKVWLSNNRAGGTDLKKIKMKYPKGVNMEGGAGKSFMLFNVKSITNEQDDQTFGTGPRLVE